MLSAEVSARFRGIKFLWSGSSSEWDAGRIITLCKWRGKMRFWAIAEVGFIGENSLKFCSAVHKAKGQLHCSSLAFTGSAPCTYTQEEKWRVYASSLFFPHWSRKQVGTLNSFLEKNYAFVPLARSMSCDQSWREGLLGKKIVFLTSVRRKTDTENGLVWTYSRRTREMGEWGGHLFPMMQNLFVRIVNCHVTSWWTWILCISLGSSGNV